MGFALLCAMWSFLLFSLSFVFSYFTEYFVYGGTVVSTIQGRVRGTTGTSSDGTVYSVFYGIPYARAPVNNLRFQPPVEWIEPWVHELNATQKPRPCVQEDDGLIMGIEDCLNLNIYAPVNVKPGDNLPVIVFIVGGIYKSGNNTECVPCLMMNKNRNVIIVMPNFRLGVLGLLSTGDSVLPGNMALKDQTIALKWVKRNIRSFGGDPNRITFHGHSSGAMNVHLHLLSPLSKGLFHRAIIQSGTSLLPMAYFDRETSRNVAFEFGSLLGCNATTSEGLLKCLLTVKAEDFPAAQNNMYVWNMHPSEAAFRPTIEDANNPASFLTEIPIRASYQDPNVTIMIGMTSGEGSGIAASTICTGDQIIRQLNTQSEIILPVMLSYEWTANFKDSRYLSRILKKHYFGDSQINTSTVSNFSEMLTEGMFGYGISQTIRAFKGRKYLYLFDYMLDYYTKSSQQCLPHRIGVDHGDDFGLIYCKKKYADKVKPIDLILGAEIVARIVNFAHSGDPDKPHPINTTIFGEWKPVRSNRYEYLYLNYNGTMRENFRRKIYDYWKTLPIYSKFVE